MQLNLDPKLVLGILGNATAMALFLSPTPTFVRIFKLKSTEEFSGLPYVCTLFNCLLWVLYGLPTVKPHSMLIISINGFGVAMELLFISTYVTFATMSSKMKVTRYMGVVGTLYGVITVITLFAFHTLVARQLFVGSVCVVVGVAMYAAPLSIMGLVTRTKSVEFMPFTLSLCNFGNSAVWTAYSFVTMDIFVGIPNGIGCVFGLVQLGLYFFYHKSTKIGSNDEKMEEGKGKPNIVYVNKSYKDIKSGLSQEKSKPPNNKENPPSNEEKSKPPKALTTQLSRSLSHSEFLSAQV